MNIPSRWLITGGCGFLGKQMIALLEQKGASYVRVVDNLTVGTREDLASACDYSEVSVEELGKQAPSSGFRVELVEGTILDETLMMEAGKDMDVMLHLAANTGVGPSVENPRHDMLSNVVGTFNCLESARHNSVKRFIFASSGAPAGEVEPPIHEELAPHPVSPYGASKLSGEGYCSAYWNTFGLETVSLRFGNVYGPGSGHKTSVVAKFISNALQGEPLTIYGDGAQTRDFIFLGDLLEAIVAAATKPGIGGETFQIATNRERSVSELLEVLTDTLGSFGVEGVKVVHDSPRLGDVRRNFSDTTKARDILGWKAATSLEEGLALTVESFLKP